MVRSYNRYKTRRKVPWSVTVDAWLIIFGVIAAILISRSHNVELAVSFISEYAVLGSFFIGTLFTSILTTAPAIVAISEFSYYVPAWQIATFGAAGAVLSDALLFRFIRSPFTDYIIRAAVSPKVRRLGSWIEKSPLWWVVPLLGALVIASPLPDEVGLLMMGVSRIRFSSFVVLSYVMNFIGILAIAAAAQALHAGV